MLARKSCEACFTVLFSMEIFFYHHCINYVNFVIIFLILQLLSFISPFRRTLFFGFNNPLAAFLKGQNRFLFSSLISDPELATNGGFIQCPAPRPAVLPRGQSCSLSLTLRSVSPMTQRSTSRVTRRSYSHFEKRWAKKSWPLQFWKQLGRDSKWI